MLHVRSLLALLVFCAAVPAVAEPPKKTKQPPKFSHYLLVLSYAPDFCSEPGGDKDPRECGIGRKVGFVVHGLWPQNETSKGPQNCGSSPVSQAIIQATLKYVPTEGLIQHEWKAHGTCSGLSTADYFAALRKARDSVTIPVELDQPAQKLKLKPAEVEAKIAAANPAFPPGSVRTSCYNDKALKEIKICLKKDLTPRACGSSAGECKAPVMTMLPVR